MSSAPEHRPTRFSRRWLSVAAAGLAVVLLLVFQSIWGDPLKAWLASGKPAGEEHGHGEEEHGHDHAGHDHAGHSEINSLELSEQARRNIGLQTLQIELKPFERTISIPGIVVENPGRSIVEITAPMTGVVTRIYPILGEAVQPGQKLFDVRLTHEELVQAQGDFLRTAEELAVIGREVERLERVTADGAIAGKTLLERKYEQQKQLATQRAQKQALLLHGLSEEQIENILTSHTLVQSLTIVAPGAEDATARTGRVSYQVQDLKVELGKHVEAGETLAVLANHAELLIEGSAFEKDIAPLNETAGAGRSVSAVVESDGRKLQVISGLKILYLSGKVDPTSRVFHFYVTLPNTLLREDAPMSGHRFIYWQFKPGQRVQLQLPVEVLPDRIVLPADAVAQDGIETYVFQANGNHFDRRPVHVEYRDQSVVVIANDGTLFPGDTVAVSGASQLQLAIKNKSGGAIDPHAGHNH